MPTHKPTSSGREETHAVPPLALTHGQTLWLLEELGLSRDVTVSTFNYYLKGLRKLGVPFEKGKGQSAGRRHVTYDFEELMELVVVLLLRVYGWLPDDVIAGLRRYRSELRPIFRQAYSDSVRHLHPVAHISARAEERTTLEGLFLDLNIHYSGGRLIQFGPPRALSPFEALSIYARSSAPARSYLPLNVTAVAELILSHARALPRRRPARGSRAQ